MKEPRYATSNDGVLEPHQYVAARSYHYNCAECGNEKGHPSHVLPVSAEEMTEMAAAYASDTKED